LGQKSKFIIGYIATITQIKFPSAAVGAASMTVDLNQCQLGGCEYCLEIWAILSSLVGINLA